MVILAVAIAVALTVGGDGVLRHQYMQTAPTNMRISESNTKISSTVHVSNQLHNLFVPQTVNTVTHQTVNTVTHQTVNTVIHQTVNTVIHQTVNTVIHQTIILPYVIFHTNWLHEAFLCYLLLLHVSASLPGHLHS